MAKLLAFGASVLELTTEENERLETASRLNVAVAGPESNAAIAASRLGTESAWLSKLPDTALGRHIRAELARHGVETAIHWSDDGRQGLAFSERGGPPREDAKIDDRAGAAVASATPEQLPLSSVDGVSMAYTSGATVVLSETLTETTGAFLDSTSRRGTTALGLSRSRAFESRAAREAVRSVLPTVDVFLTTEEGAAALGTQGTPIETVHALASTHDFETVVLTREERGALVWHDKTVHEHHLPETETVDDRGAFDALCGAFLARRLTGERPNRALAAGVACAALARTIRGSVPVVTREEVERCVERMEYER